MSDSTPPQLLYRRDGTSQAARMQAALSPEYVGVDERSLQDLLAFAREYATELKYYTDDNQAMGDWSAFLGAELDLDAVVAFMREPERVPPEQAAIYTRPHFVLFLTFLHLLRHAQEHLNSLTRRHLDFYYRQVLRMTKQPGTPDQVAVLVDLAEDTKPFLLPAGTRLNAGTDSMDQALVYRTDHDLVVNHAQVARLSSLYVDQQGTGFNLYPAKDATAVAVDLGGAADAVTSPWRTFGQAQSSDRSSSPPPSFGWAISSPLLALSQGTRTITLTLSFQTEQFNEEAIREALAPPGPFCIQMSTEKGWIKLDTIPVIINDLGDEALALKALQFNLVVAENVDALAPPPAEMSQIDSPWPVLRLLLRQMLQPFKALVLVKTHLKVEVTGLPPLQVQNDETVLDAKKPFEPFGSSPAVGARFYLGHPELVYKKIDSFHFHLEWMGVPSDLATYYKNYDAINYETNFTARISLIDQRLDLLLAQSDPLFARPDATAIHCIGCPDVAAAIRAGRPGHHYDRASALVIDADLLAWNRYVQWELNAPDFQHAAYPAVAVKKSLELATDIANKQTNSNNDPIKADSYQVNPPYTPKIKSLTLCYTSSIEIIMADYKPGSQMDRVFHIQPFGACEILPASDSDPKNYPFLPQYDNEGELYLGIQDARPPQNLSLLLQMAEGSANPDLEPEPVQWSYLSGNRWMSLSPANGKLLQDDTRGLINSGIITFALEPAQPNTLLPADLYWLRAAIEKNSASVCATIAIKAQAVFATFADDQNAPDHLSRPLPVGSITDLAAPLPEITGIRQPYTSYGGKMAEEDRTFYTRLSERLRHKQRALSVWDYEHLVLEQFPGIYKAKCLPADLTAHPSNPGAVEIIVIPDIRNQLPFHPFEPKASSKLIADIETYLANYSPAWATVKVKNAHYVEVQVRVAVRFLPDYNEGYYTQHLIEAINRFLSPWAYEEGVEIEIGGQIYVNAIVDFIQERPYVDYVAKVEVADNEDGGFNLILDDDRVQAKRPDGVLVAAGGQHIIDLIDRDTVFTGIGYMIIEFDFIVS